jgi:hypothetical protein
MQAHAKLLIRSAAVVAVLSAALSTLAGCTLIQPVQPWEKGTLAKPEMTIQGSDPLEAKFADHIYSSREAASGGSGVGGGGCGCN